MLVKNSIVETEIRAISGDGNGIGAADGMTLFVPYSAVGDKLRVKILSVKKSYAYAAISEIIEPSPDRVNPLCPSFGKCGGCCFEHLTRQSELRAKREVVAHALKRIGNIDFPVDEVVFAKEYDGYRNKVVFPVRQGENGIEFGLYAARSHRIVSACECRLQPQLLNDIAAETCRILNRFGVTAYDESTGKGLVRHIFLRANKDCTNVLLCVVANGSRLPREDEFARQITAFFPCITSVCVNKNAREGNVILGDTTRAVLGDPWLEDELCGVRVQLKPTSFFQVNRQAATLLYGLVAEMLPERGVGTLLDLYCGTGTIGLSLLPRVERLVGVDVEPSAIEAARANPLASEKAEFYCGDAGEITRDLLKKGLHFDVIITDPPRKGCDQKTLELLLELRPQTLIMVSCDPATLARDLKYLTQNGYALKRAVPCDMFPRTAHIETAVCLTRKG